MTAAVSLPMSGQDGWIEWSGGENPVPGQWVWVRFRDGSGSSLSKSEPWSWLHAPSGHRVDPNSDIIAYRLSSRQQVKS